MIRKATIEDSQKIAALYIGSRKRHMRFARPAHSDEETCEWIRACLIPTHSVLVFEKDNEILAMMATSTDEEGSWINQLHVEADCTGQGFGGILLARALEDLRRPIRLYTFQESEGARRFYERNGFRAVKLSDGSENEENCPDVLYILDTEEPHKANEATPCSRTSSSRSTQLASAVFADIALGRRS